MTNHSNRYPSYSECVADALRASEEPLTLDALVAHVEQRRPITQGAHSAIYKAVDTLYQAVPVGQARYGWLSRLLNGSTIRHTLEADELRRPYILMDELEHAFFFPQFFQEQEPEERELEIELFGEATVFGRIAATRDMWALKLEPAYTKWLEEQGAMAHDDLILHVVDAEAGRYVVRLQPREARDEAAIERTNVGLAREAEESATDLLRRRPAVLTWELVARLIGRGCFKEAMPPDDLHYVLNGYSRLELVEGLGYELQLSSARSASAPDGQKLRTRGSGEGGQANQRGRRYRLEGDSEDVMDDLFGSASSGQNEDSCEAYEEYLEAFEGADRPGSPLGHDDYHLLEAELESLVDLELEFGYLLEDQLRRKQELSERLFIDPESLVDGAWSEEDDLDSDSPALWN
jgi:hypothetical protein